MELPVSTTHSIIGGVIGFARELLALVLYNSVKLDCMAGVHCADTTAVTPESSEKTLTRRQLRGSLLSCNTVKLAMGAGKLSLHLHLFL